MANLEFPSAQSSRRRSEQASLRRDESKDVTLYTMLAGVLAGLLMTILMAGARSSGLFAFSLERSFGELLLGTQGQAAFAVGLLVHLAASAIFALSYAEGFQRFHIAGAKIGAAFGVMQWLAVGIFIGLMPAMRPMLAARLSTAGPLGMNLGAFGFFFLLFVHLIYGAIVGSSYLRMSEEHPELLRPVRRPQLVKRSDYQHE